VRASGSALRFHELSLADANSRTATRTASPAAYMLEKDNDVTRQTGGDVVLSNDQLDLIYLKLEGHGWWGP
jgi:hypothetical protein